MLLLGGGAIYLLYYGFVTATQEDAPSATANTQPPSAPSQAAPPSRPSTPSAHLPPPTPAPEIAKPKVAAPPPSTAVPDQQVAKWVEDLRPQSISRSRMMIGGQRYELGSLVEENLQIRWIAIDMDLGVLVFEDAKGVRYEKDF